MAKFWALLPSKEGKKDNKKYFLKIKSNVVCVGRRVPNAAPHGRVNHLIIPPHISRVQTASYFNKIHDKRNMSFCQVSPSSRLTEASANSAAVVRHGLRRFTLAVLIYVGGPGAASRTAQLRSCWSFCPWGGTLRNRGCRHASEHSLRSGGWSRSALDLGGPRTVSLRTWSSLT